MRIPSTIAARPGTAPLVRAPDDDPHSGTDSGTDGGTDGGTAGGAAAGTSLWWLGQAGFALRHRGTTLLIDPYLSDSLAEKYRGRLFPHARMHAPPVDPARLTGVDAVLHTHAHTDHMDPWTIRDLLRGNTPVFVAPRAEREQALRRGIPAGRLTGLTAGEHLVLGPDIEIHAVPAAHEELETDERGDHRFLGYVIRLGGLTLYHSGDCVPYPGQAELLAGHGVDVALLPVNGRDAHRLANGVPGNFTVREAARLCREAGIPTLVCHHIGLFDFNTVDPRWAAEQLRAHAAGLDWLLPDLAVPYELRHRTEGDRP
ncbi:MAG: hypothetical protein K0R62_2334 [Nonomuraea muscovyensis]|nr:hypothetical protein [Nonomuraea muscovyensis]